MVFEGIFVMFERVVLNLGILYILLRLMNRVGRFYGKVLYYLVSFKKEFSIKFLFLGYRWFFFRL